MNSVKTVFLMTLMMVLFLFVGSMLGGETGLIIAFVFALAMNFGSYWFSDKIVLKMYRAQEAKREEYPQLFESVNILSQRAKIPMPKVYVINSPNPNAFATGRNPDNAAVAVTTGIMQMLNREELDGVIAHELTHVSNRDILVGTIAATLVGTITFVSRMAGWAAIFGGRDDDDTVSSLALIIIAPIAAVLLQLAVSRSREYMADAGGAKLTGNALYLASALEKLHQGNKKAPMRNAAPASAHMFIVNPLSGKSVMKLFSTHPPMEERVRRLRDIARDVR